MAAKVERRHREASLIAHDWTILVGIDGWCDVGGPTWLAKDGTVVNLSEEDASAQAIAEAEARGRAAERADVVAWMRDPLNHRTLRTNAGCIERGDHEEAAGKECEDEKD